MDGQFQISNFKFRVHKSRSDIISYEQFESLTKVAAKMGITKIRLLADMAVKLKQKGLQLQKIMQFSLYDRADLGRRFQTERPPKCTLGELSLKIGFEIGFELGLFIRTKKSSFFL